jgi:DNA-binding NtrC family response regulator
MNPHYNFQRSVLVIDDLRKSETLIKQGLLSYPVHFEFCQADCDKAILKLSKNHHDLVIVSLEFEIGSILKFAEKMHQEWTNLPSIFMTEPHLLDIQKSLLKVAAFEIIERPVNGPADLIHRMDQVARSYRKAS